MVWKRGIISVKGYWKSPVLGSAGRKQSPDQGTDVTCRFCGTFVLTILQIRKRRSTCCLGQSFVSSGDCLFYSELQTHEIADNLHCPLYSVALACTHPIHPVSPATCSCGACSSKAFYPFPTPTAHSQAHLNPPRLCLVTSFLI